MYSFYFGRLLLPVTPQKLTTKIKGNNKTLTLVNEGDINFLRSPGLTEISFDVVLPMLGQYSFAGTFRRPDYYLGIFENYMTNKTPFRFIVSRVSPSGRLLFDTNMKVSLESYNITEDATKGPDVTVSVTLVYRLRDEDRYGNETGRGREQAHHQGGEEARDFEQA